MAEEGGMTCQYYKDQTSVCLRPIASTLFQLCHRHLSWRKDDVVVATVNL
jgi:hypothetical protein